MSKRHVPYFDKLKSRWRVEIGGRNFWCGKDQATAIKLTNALDSFWETEIVGVNGKKSWSNKSIVEAYNRVGMTPPASVSTQPPVVAQVAVVQPTSIALTPGPRFRPAFQPREISFHDALDVYVKMRLAKRTIRRAGEDSEQIIDSLKHHLADMPLQDIDAAVHRILTDKIINLPPNRTTGKPISIVTARWWLRELGAAFEWFSHPDSRIGWIPPYPQWREKFSINDEEAKALAKNVGDENFGKVKPIFNLDQLAILHKCTTPLDRLYLLGGVCLGWTAIEFATLKRSQIQTDQDGETYIVNKERSKTGVEMTFWVCPELAELLKQFVAATPPNPGDLAMMTRNRQGEPLPLVHNGTDTISQSWHRLLRRVNKTEKRVPPYPHSRLRKLAGQLVENITGNHDLAQMVLSHKRKDVDVLIAATKRLKIMSKGRYQLQRRKERADLRSHGGLDLEVFDAHTGFSRAAATLSGGESFLASLSLALGLADVVQAQAGGIRMETMFIDEGFGSLDSETVDLAIRSLIELFNDGRLIGIISHMTELQERIDARLEIAPALRGSAARFVLS